MTTTGRGDHEANANASVALPENPLAEVTTTILMNARRSLHCRNQGSHLHDDAPEESDCQCRVPSLAAEAAVAASPSASWIETTTDSELLTGAESTSRTVASVGAVARFGSEVG